MTVQPLEHEIVTTIPGSGHHNIMGLEETWLRLIDFAPSSVLPEPKVA
ncbi:hypothetical protein [Verminephrobacter aporrectodeae]|nr:hypothetical protein [Verminephrobacter aporrectodeae]